jgi:hypothetical protein
MTKNQKEKFKQYIPCNLTEEEREEFEEYLELAEESFTFKEIFEQIKKSHWFLIKDTEYVGFAGCDTYAELQTLVKENLLDQVRIPFICIQNKKVDWIPTFI